MEQFYAKLKEKLTGKELEERGFKVKMTQKYDSKLFEIEIVN